MSNDPDHNLLRKLEEISSKLNNSAALNGKFDSLYNSVENIKENQEKIGEKVEKIHDSLYEPDTGFFARVAQIEQRTETIEKTFLEHTKQDGEFYKKIEYSIKEVEPKQEEKYVIKKLSEIGGDNLIELQSVIKLRKSFQKIFWAVIAGTGSLIFKILYDIFVVYINIKH